MVKARFGLFRILGFFDNYKAPAIVAALLLFSFCSSAQYDSTKTQQAIAAYGYTWKNAQFFSSLIIPNDTTKLALRDSGAIAYKGGAFWMYNGRYWITAGGGGGTTFAGYDSIIVSGPTICPWLNGSSQCYTLDTTFLATRHYVDSLYASIRSSIPGANIANGLDSGHLIYDSLLDFHTTRLKYHINNVYYTALPDTFSLDPSDAIYDRRDYIYVDIYGNVGVLTGTPGASAVPPDYDPDTQFILAEALVRANASTPANFGNLYIYRNNVETFIGTSNITGAIFDTTLNAFSAPVATYFPSFTPGKYIQFEEPAGNYSRTDRTILKGRIRLAAVWPTTAFISLKFMNASTSISSYVSLKNNTYNFNRNLINVWQDFTIDLSDFKFTSDAFSGMYINTSGTSATAFQLEDIVVQTGGAVPQAAAVVNSWNNRTGHVIPVATDMPFYITNAWFEGRAFKYTIGRDTFTRALPTDTTKFDTDCFTLVEKETSGSAYDTLKFKFSCLDSLLALKENSLGNPDVDGKVLSSTAAGVRSWVTMSGGGGGTSTIDQTVVASAGGQTAFVFTTIPTRYILFVNGTEFTDFSVAGTTITVGMTDILAGDKIRIFETQ